MTAVEFPIEDGTITVKQLERCIKGLVGLIDDFYPILKRALDTGVVDFPEQPILPSGSTGMMAQMLLAALKASGKADTDPEVLAAKRLVEELERGGSGGAPTSV